MDNPINRAADESACPDALCDAVRLALSDGAVLDGEQAKHLESCAACRAFRKQTQTMLTDLAGLAVPPLTKNGVGVADAVMDEIRRQAIFGRSPRPGRRFFRHAGLVAACVTVLVMSFPVIFNVLIPAQSKMDMAEPENTGNTPVVNNALFKSDKTVLDSAAGAQNESAPALFAQMDENSETQRNLTDDAYLGIPSEAHLDVYAKDKASLLTDPKYTVKNSFVSNTASVLDAENGFDTDSAPETPADGETLSSQTSVAPPPPIPNEMSAEPESPDSITAEGAETDGSSYSETSSESPVQSEPKNSDDIRESDTVSGSGSSKSLMPPPSANGEESTVAERQIGSNSNHSGGSYIPELPDDSDRIDAGEPTEEENAADGINSVELIAPPVLLAHKAAEKRFAGQYVFGADEAEFVKLTETTARVDFETDILTVKIQVFLVFEDNEWEIAVDADGNEQIFEVISALLID